MKYGEAEMQRLGEFYGAGKTAIVRPEDLKSEWLRLRCTQLPLSMKEVLVMPAKQSTTISGIYGNLNKLAQIYLTFPIATTDFKRRFFNHAWGKVSSKKSNE